MPSAVRLEESIEQVINHASYHLNNNIYPEFDPVYRGETKGEIRERKGGVEEVEQRRTMFCLALAESGVLPRQKRRYAGHSAAHKTTMPVYHRLIEVLDNLALLLESNPLTDITVLKVRDSLCPNCAACMYMAVTLFLFHIHSCPHLEHCLSLWRMSVLCNSVP